MAREISISNRRKATIETNKGTLAVGRNHEGGSFNSVEDSILYLMEDNHIFSVGLDEAKRLHAAIGEVIADAEQIIEDAKPKTLTAAELEALGTGASIYIDDDQGYREFIKTDRGDFVKTRGVIWMLGMTYTPSTLHGFTFKKEEN